MTIKIISYLNVFMFSLFLGHCWSQFPNIEQPSAGSRNVSSVQHLSQVDINSAHCIWWRSALALTRQTSQHREWFCPCSSLSPAGGAYGETEPCEFLHVAILYIIWVFIWKEEMVYVVLIFIKVLFKICLTLLDGGKPNGDDQFPGGTGEDVGDCCAPCAEEFKERGGAVFSTFGF